MVNTILEQDRERTRQRNATMDALQRQLDTENERRDQERRERLEVLERKERQEAEERKQQRQGSASEEPSREDKNERQRWLKAQLARERENQLFAEEAEERARAREGAWRREAGHLDATRWVREDGTRRGMLEGKNGRWHLKSYHVDWGGSRKLYLETWLTAVIVDEKGNPKSDGGFLEITNHSPRYPAYYGLSAVVNAMIEPGRTERLYLPIYRSKLDNTPTSVDLMVQYWDDSPAS